MAAVSVIGLLTRSGLKLYDISSLQEILYCFGKFELYLFPLLDPCSTLFGSKERLNHRVSSNYSCQAKISSLVPISDCYDIDDNKARQ